MRAPSSVIGGVTEDGSVMSMVVGSDGRLSSNFGPDTPDQLPQSGRWTVNLTSDIAIPDSARIIRIRPVTNEVRYCMGAAPAAAGANAFSLGGIALADQWETFIPETGVGRHLRLLATVSTSVDVEYR